MAPHPVLPPSPCAPQETRAALERLGAEVGALEAELGPPGGKGGPAWQGALAAPAVVRRVLARAKAAAEGLAPAPAPLDAAAGCEAVRAYPTQSGPTTPR